MQQFSHVYAYIYAALTANASERDRWVWETLSEGTYPRLAICGNSFSYLKRSVHVRRHEFVLNQACEVRDLDFSLSEPIPSSSGQKELLRVRNMKVAGDGECVSRLLCIKSYPVKYQWW